MVKAILVWQAISVGIFAMGTMFLSSDTKSLCPCGKDFVPKSKRVSQFLTRLGNYIEGKSVTSSIGAGVAIIVALQLLPPIYLFEMGWRLVKRIHSRHCLPYQLSRTEFKK